MTKDEILARKTGCGGNAGLMESEENIKPFPSLPTVLGNHQRTVITTFPPHGDYYWIWTLLLCSRQDISALQQQMISDTLQRKPNPSCLASAPSFRPVSRVVAEMQVSAGCPKIDRWAQQRNRTRWRNIVSTENLRIIDAIQLHGRYAYELCLSHLPTERQ